MRETGDRAESLRRRRRRDVPIPSSTKENEIHIDRIARYVTSASVPLATTAVATLAAPSVGDIVVNDAPLTVQNDLLNLSTANGAMAGVFNVAAFSSGVVFNFDPEGGLGVVSATSYSGFSEWARLGAGDMIGGDNMEAAVFGSLYFVIRYSGTGGGSDYTYGPFGNFRADDGELSSGYIGFTFDDDLGDSVYAWAEITLQSDGILTVERWAYDDEGGSIAAGAIPAPSALGLLALAGGAAGIRRKRQA